MRPAALLLIGDLALDRLGAVADPDLDFAWLRLLRLTHVYFEHAVLVLRRDGVFVDTLWQADRAREGAEPSLEAEVFAVLSSVLTLALSGDRERAVLKFD